ncbi:MAG: 16S rRNA (cytosine(967)-C(5))-methyltransferase RsmB [Eubacteriales bacterium]|nr:16S rRNA (cytosine(967)-C(5))-methyltransferase RsmB [Eubacteriales bacterium]
MNAREAALKALFEVEQNGAYSDIALKNILRNSNLSAADKAFASEITYGVIRHKTRLDEIIKSYSSIRLKKLSVWILSILRMGVYQLFFLDRVPESAAVNESVNLAKRYGHKGSVGYVNAVLRAVAKGGEPKYTSLEAYYSHPAWLIDLLCKQYPEDYKKILAANNRPAPVTVRINPLKTTPEDLANRLLAKGIDAGISDDTEGLLEISKFGDISALEEYNEGLFTPQDKGAYLAAKAVGAKKGELILDVCAAPGGKTTQLAEDSQNEGKIIAFDIHQHKITLIQKNAQRLGLSCICAICHDATLPKAEYIGKADKVLADVPCSGLGIIRKKPDIKWRKTPEDLAQIIPIQKQILETSSKYVKKGGVLVYATCTVNKAENHDVTEEFAKENTCFEKIHEVQLLPHLDECDGFYICVFKKL